MKRKLKHRFALFLVLFLSGLAAASAFAQSAPIWTGSITCQLDDEEQGIYQRQEIQTWTLTGGPADPSQGIPVYQATWQAQAQGQLLRTQQATQTTASIQWVANVPAPGGQAPLVPIAIRFRASDGKMIVGQWRAPMSAPNALNGYRQIFVSGVAQGQPAPFSRALQEWKIPLIEAPNDSTITGSVQAPVDPGTAEIVHRYGGFTPTGSCQWKLTKAANSQNSGQTTLGSGLSPRTPQTQNSTGNSGAQTNGQNCQSPATVQQTFETMKAQLQAQYDKLIQGTSDPGEIASLKSQEQRTIAALNNQEQHDMAQASQGCLPAANNAGGSNGGGPSGAMAGSTGGSGGSSAAGGGANTGSGSNAGGAANGGIASGGAAGAAGAGGSSAAGGGANAGSGSNASGAANGGIASGGAAGSAGAGGSSAAGGGANAGSGSNANGAANGGAANGGAAGAAGAGGSSAAGGSAMGSGSSGGGSSGQGGGSAAGGGAGSTQVSPQLLSISPSSVSQGSTITVRLTGQGTHWQNQNTNLSFGPQITVQSFTADPGGTSGTANITVAADASAGTRPVMLMTGAELVGLAAGLTVTASSTQNSGSSGGLQVGTPNHTITSMAMLSGVSPTTNNGQPNVTVTLTGQLTHFATGSTKVSFARSATQPQGNSISVPANAALQSLSAGKTSPPALQAGQVQATTGTSLSVPVTMNPASAAGSYDITVTTPTSGGTETVTLKNVFTVTNTSTITGVNVTPTIPKNIGSSTPSAPTSAKYRAVITGLMCMYHVSSSDAVYAAAVVRQYDRRNNQNTMLTNMNTWVYGDVNGMQGQRKQAGTRGPGGGMGDGDLAPSGFLPGARDTMPTPQVNNLLPLTLWEGTLTDGVDALVISPSIWINYGDNPFFSTWNQNEDSFTNSIFTDSRIQNQINTQTLGPLVLGSSQTVGGSFAQSYVGDLAQVVIDTVLVIPFVELQGNPSHDRPIGVVDAASHDATASMVLPNTTIVLTREMIEKRLGSGSWMMMPLDVNDTAHGFTGLAGSDRPGHYQMFLQIERQ